MYLLVLTICLRLVASAGSSYDESETTGVTIFERYAGNLIYNRTDGRCIACDGVCDLDHVVSPHSWKARLGVNNDFDSCQHYATSVIEFGVVAFTWWNSSQTCSLHVLDDDHDISAEMMNFNGYTWTEEHVTNTGPIFRTRYPKEFYGVEIDAKCYYSLTINPTKNIVALGNQLCFLLVVVTMIAWYTWMRYTGHFPSDSPHEKPATIDYRLKNSRIELTGKKNA